MRHAVAAGLIAGTLFALPASATAGAPNYDCRVAGGGRIAIDQWAAVISASGFEHLPSAWGTAASVRQNGPSLDLRAKLDGATWTVTVRGSGSSLAITRPAGNLAGRCAFIPGNYVLRRTNRGGYTMRAAPSVHAKLLARIPLDSPIWRTPIARRTPPGCQCARQSFATERCNRSMAGCDKRGSNRFSSIAAPPIDRGNRTRPVKTARITARCSRGREFVQAS